MRDFSWKYFAMTGDVDAYLLYREAGEPLNLAAESPAEEEQVYDEEAQ
ncbi:MULTISPECIES: YqzL family protein [Paenibacillus]|uniref:YqzL family protein n=1 Tax=Paenibacillus rhizophilus TaxID=1850366 RepID=A0A3N9P8K3_9BACL|nr:MULTISPECIES: YqzL family protein [Paenibacillus]RQW11667.1 YqzL family protein [Paenibacillus rhizophilus]BCG60288.1 hypothetical protein PUR_37130 [Paenibacillus sp. URB8-2]